MTVKFRDRPYVIEKGGKQPANPPSAPVAAMKIPAPPPPPPAERRDRSSKE